MLHVVKFSKWSPCFSRKFDKIPLHTINRCLFTSLILNKISFNGLEAVKVNLRVCSFISRDCINIGEMAYNNQRIPKAPRA